MDDSGGVGAVWIRTMPGSSGRIVVKATDTVLGSRSVPIVVRPDTSSNRI